MCRLNRERISELQQQVEDLQKALQSQAAKPDDVSVPGVLEPLLTKCSTELILLGCLDLSMALWKENPFAFVFHQNTELI